MTSKSLGFQAVNLNENTTDPVFGIILSSFCGVGAIVNGVMIIVFLRERKRKHFFNVTYLNLSCSDFLWALFGACIEGPGLILESGYEEKRVLCTLQPILFYLIVHANLLAMLPITYDRFTAVIIPLRYTKKRHLMHQKWLIAGCWLAAILFLVFLASEVAVQQPEVGFGNFINYDDEGHHCMFNYENKKKLKQRLSLASTIIFALIPLLINILTYSLILYKLYKVRSAKVRMISMRAILICVTFTLSWLPCFILYDLMGRRDLRTIYHSVLFINCLTDPILYAFTSRIIKKKLSVVKRTRQRFGRRSKRRSCHEITFQLSVNLKVFVERKPKAKKLTTPTPY